MTATEIETLAKSLRDELPNGARGPNRLKTMAKEVAWSLGIDPDAVANEWDAIVVHPIVAAMAAQALANAICDGCGMPAGKGNPECCECRGRGWHPEINF